MKPIKTIYKIAFICAMIAAILPSIPQTASAVGGLLVSPKRVVFGPNERLQEIRVVNRGEETQKYRISVINRKMMEDGQMQPATQPGENEFFADKFLRYGPRQVELGPKETQTIRLMSRLPANAQPGEYRSHILVQEIPEASAAQDAANNADGSVGVNVQAIFGMSIPVFMRKGDLSADITLSNAKIIRSDGSTFAQVNINRSGNKSVLGTTKVFAGDEEIAILKGIAVYLSAPYRTVLLEIPEEYAKTIAGKTLRVTYTASETGEDTPPAEISFNAS